MKGVPMDALRGYHPHMLPNRGYPWMLPNRGNSSSSVLVLQHGGGVLLCSAAMMGHVDTSTSEGQEDTEGG